MPDEINSIEEQLKRDEGFVSHAYRDSLGYLTIGIGRLIDERRGGGITLDEAYVLLRNDLAEIQQELYAELPWLEYVHPIRQAVFENMSYQLGIAGLLEFVNTLAAAQRHDWPATKAGMLDSLWATQTPNRAHRLAEQIVTGEWQ